MTGAMARDEPRIQRAYVPRVAGNGRTEVRYIGGGQDGWSDTYHYLLTMPLAVFFATMGGVYLAVNAVFGLIYFFVGGIDNMRPGNLLDAFFFSVETISTVGYGVMAPRSVPAHLVMTVELRRHLQSGHRHRPAVRPDLPPDGAGDVLPKGGGDDP